MAETLQEKSIEEHEAYEDKETYEMVAKELEALIASNGGEEQKIEWGYCLLKQAKDVPTDYEYEGKKIIADVYVVRNLIIGAAAAEHHRLEKLAEGVFLDEESQEIETVPNAMGIELRVEGAEHSGIDGHTEGANWSIAYGMAGEPILERMQEMVNVMKRAATDSSVSNNA